VTVKVVGHVLGDKIRIGKRRPKERLSQADGFSRVSVADRGPVDRRHRQAHDGRRDSGRGEGDSRAQAESRDACTSARS